MKNTWKKWGLVLFSVFIFGFKGNDSVELAGHFNARKDPDFQKSARNVKFVLPPKTRGKILKEKELKPSGNMGFLIEVLDGPKKGEQVWIYYHLANQTKENPDIRLYKSDDGKTEETKDPKDAKSVQTEKDTEGWMPERMKSAITTFKAVTGIKDTKEMSNRKPTPEEVFEKVEQANRKLKEPCSGDCEVKKTYQRPTSQPAASVKKAEPVVETKKAEKPKKEESKKAEPAVKSELASGKAETVAAPSNPKFKLDTTQDRSATIGKLYKQENHYPVSLGWHEDRGGYIVGKRGGPNGPVEGFQISNQGPNKVVTNPGVPGKGQTRRSWEFFHVGEARQDLSFTVSDSFGKEESGSRESVMMIFPRNTMPQVRAKGDKVIVTLANGETISYNKNTQEILNGVFSENAPIASGVTPRVQYHGKGVLVRVDSARSQDARDSKTATISKQGHPDCKVPTTDLWPKAKEKHFKYFSDSDFQVYLRQKCGFDLNK